MTTGSKRSGYYVNILLRKFGENMLIEKLTKWQFDISERPLEMLKTT